MALSDLLKDGRLRLMPRMRRASPRQARQAARIVPVIGCIPGSEVWFFRFALAFLAHLGQGGQIVDRLSGRVVGNAAGRPFNFDHLSGRAAAVGAQSHRLGPPLHRPRGLSRLQQDRRRVSVVAGHAVLRPRVRLLPRRARLHAGSGRHGAARHGPGFREGPRRRGVGRAQPTRRPRLSRPSRSGGLLLQFLPAAFCACVQHAGWPAARGLDVPRLPVPARPAVLREGLPLLSGHVDPGARLRQHRAALAAARASGRDAGVDALPPDGQAARLADDRGRRRPRPPRAPGGGGARARTAARRHAPASRQPQPRCSRTRSSARSSTPTSAAKRWNCWRRWGSICAISRHLPAPQPLRD